MKVGIFVPLLLAGLVLLAACAQPAGSSPPSTTKSITNVVPMIAFNSAVSSGMRSIVPATMSSTDINYFIFCPVLTGFGISTAGVTEGEVLAPQPFLNTTMTMVANSFSGGTNGIASGVRFTGTLADGSGSMVLELDTSTLNFWSEQKLFIDDPNKVVDLSHLYTSQTVIHSVNHAKLQSDGSAVATATMSFYSVLSSGSKLLAVAPKCEFYCGAWNDATSSLSGAGMAFLNMAGTQSPSAVYGTVSQPSGTLDATKIESTIAYINAFISTNPTQSTQYSVFYKTSTDGHPTQYLGSPWNSVTVTTPSLAKANLPSPKWITVSSLDAF